MIKVAIVSVLVATGISAYVWHVSQRQAVLEVYVFDTPGVPAVFVRTPSDIRMLINGGSNADVVRRATKVLPFYSRRIDYVVASDNQDKTVNGLRDIIDRYSVNEVFSVSGTSVLPGAKRLQAGETLLLDKDVRVEVFFPAAESDFEYSNASYPQILLKIIHGTSQIIFAGQATNKILKHIGFMPDGLIPPPHQFLIHKYMVNGINIKKNGPVKIVTDGRSSKVESFR